VEGALTLARRMLEVAGDRAWAAEPVEAWALPVSAVTSRQLVSGAVTSRRKAQAAPTLPPETTAVAGLAHVDSVAHGTALRLA
jgi:hypothetical protein